MITMIAAIIELVCSFTLLLLACELAGRLSYRFENVNDLIDQFDWYAFPLEMQKILPVMMMNAQQPVEVKSFGSIASNRETFRKVSETRAFA